MREEEGEGVERGEERGKVRDLHLHDHTSVFLIFRDHVSGELLALLSDGLSNWTCK